MKKILLLLLLTQLTHAASLWGLRHETESRLSIALELLHQDKLAHINKATDDFVTVGGDNSCDFRLGSNRIQTAIDSGAAEIRIASNTSYEENILISNATVSLTLRGGFADCTQASNNNQSHSIEDWAVITRATGQLAPVFNINSLPQGNMTKFENLKIMGGDSQSQGSGASVRLNETDSDAIFDNVWMTEGVDSFTGGGLSVVSSNTTVILNNTDIFNNSAVGSGGGIYCNDFSGQLKNATIILSENSHLYSNHTDGEGGGALIGNDCFLASFSGSSVMNAEKGIYNNTAVNNGGGISVFGGGNVLIYGHVLCSLAGDCFGNSTDPATVYANQANTLGNNRNGGAIAASDIGTDVSIIAGYFYNNTINPTLSAAGAGGVVSLLNQATLNISHPGLNNSTVACWDIDRCNLFSNNKAHLGGVFHTNDSEINISHAYFEDNRANLGTAIYVSGTEDLNIENAVFNNNGNNGSDNYDDAYLIDVHVPNAHVSYTTIADNKTELSVFNIPTVGSSLNLQSSIIHDSESGNVVNVAPGLIVSNCVMAHEISSISGTNNSTVDPAFVDRNNRDYHLSANSQAIDYCDVFATDLNKDINIQERGFDNTSITNFLGSYDLGADEFYDNTFLTVGGDATCDFNTATQSIQDAIDTGIGEVRIAANGNHNKTLSVGNINIKLRGGYADCNAADNDNQTTQTNIIVTVGSLQPVITITGNSQRNAIELENLNMTGLGASAVTVINANADILLNNILIQNNILAPGFFGGGIFIAESNVDFNMIDTIITENSAPQGGGLYCRGSAASVVMSGNSGLALNTTTGKGGGAYITQGCDFTMYSGTNNPTALSTTGISANIADEEGGGIYVDLGGKITLNGHQDCSQQCIGDNTNPVSVNHNKSNSGVSSGERGGGIYLTGTGTTVNVYAALFSENWSPNGGAIYVNDLANLKVARLRQDCWDNVKCNYFFKNRALGQGTGGAIQNDQGFLNVSSAYFEENDGRTGSVLYAFGSNSHNNLDSSVFNHNNNQGSGDKYVIRAANSASVEITHSTFADNFLTNTTVFGITMDSELKLLSSIVHDTDGNVLDINPGTTVIDCVMAHEITSFSGTNVFLNDPEFVDRENRDYHLDMNNSPAIDVCDDSLVNVQFNDIDFQMRGIDDISISNVNGAFDIGADEAVINDIIFRNGFD